MSENDEAGSDEGASIEVELIMDSEAFHVTVVTTETVVGATRRAVGAREGAQIEILLGDDDVSEGTFDDHGIEDGARLNVVVIDMVAFSYADEGVVLSQDNHVATSDVPFSVRDKFYRVAVGERPFEASGRQTQRMKIVEKRRNVIIGAIAAEGHDIARALSCHRNDGYDYGYIGNGPNGWVYDSDGDLSHNGRQLNSFANRNKGLCSGDIVDMTLDMEQRTLSFCVNGIQHPCCFEDVPTEIPIFFAVAVCSSGECVELTPGVTAED